jgi:hypothetical protein
MKCLLLPNFTFKSLFNPDGDNNLLTILILRFLDPQIPFQISSDSYFQILYYLCIDFSEKQYYFLESNL